MCWKGNKMNGFKIYSKKSCVACDQAKSLLTSLGHGYEVVDVMTSPTAQALFREKGFRSVPQVFYQDTLVGGFNELQQYLKKD